LSGRWVSGFWLSGLPAAGKVLAMTPPDRSLAEYWPVFGLRLATPRLILTPLRDDDLVETLGVILTGIHESSRMPFATPWTDVPRDELVANTLRYYWTARGANTPAKWSVPFIVRMGGVLVGLQDLMGADFAVTRTVSTGSWLGAEHQGKGIGAEMRSAVVQFAFDHLRAERADSGAFTDNPASLRVSEKLGYLPNGTAVTQRRPGERAVEQRLTLSPREFRRPGWDVQIAGFVACRSYFGL
jgi:RimJ/RimL family protein N-acetyltransferase